MIKIEKQYNWLVTGAAGFIGSNIVNELLSQNQVVIGFDNMSHGKRINLQNALKNDNFKLIIGDIQDIKDLTRAMEGCDFVLHQAGMVSVKESLKDILYYQDVNVNGFINLLKLSKIYEIKKVVYASSSAVYGDEIGEITSPYGLQKKQIEEYAFLFKKLFNVHSVGLQYYNVYGENQSIEEAVIPKFINQMLKKETIFTYGNGFQIRDFIYVKDVVNANIIAALSNIEYWQFPVGTGKSISIINLFEKLSKLTEYEYSILRKEKRFGDIEDSICELNDFFEWKPEYSIDEGLRNTVEHYKNKKLLSTL